MNRQYVYISDNLKAWKINPNIHALSYPRWLGPVGEIVDSEYNGVKSRWYSPDRHPDQGLPHPPREWQWRQGCE